MSAPSIVGQTTVVWGSALSSSPVICCQWLWASVLSKCKLHEGRQRVSVLIKLYSQAPPKAPHWRGAMQLCLHVDNDNLTSQLGNGIWILVGKQFVVSYLWSLKGENSKWFLSLGKLSISVFQESSQITLKGVFLKKKKKKKISWSFASTKVPASVEYK